MRGRGRGSPDDKSVVVELSWRRGKPKAAEKSRQTWNRGSEGNTLLLREIYCTIRTEDQRLHEELSVLLWRLRPEISET